MHDLIGSFDSVQEAIEAGDCAIAAKWTDNEALAHVEWYHVFDVVDRVMVAATPLQGIGAAGTPDLKEIVL